MRKTTLILFSLLTISSVSRAQQLSNDSIQVFLDKSLSILQENAINRYGVNWATLRTNVNEKVKGAKSYEEAAQIFPYIFEQIDDHHGALLYGKKSFSWNTQVAYQNAEVKKAVKTEQKLRVQLLKGDVGYILLPGNNDFSGKNIDRDAQEIRTAIAKLQTNKIRGWILDLRVNTGGSMYQMLAGLSPILGEGQLGSFINQHGVNDGNWIIRKGNIYLDKTQVSHLDEVNESKAATLPLVVLISGMTASSGEVVAISTIGRDDTMVIGEPTAGYTTANEGFKINEVMGLNLAVDYDADRNGKTYKTKVNPLIGIDGGDNFKKPELDAKVIYGLRWIKNRR